MRDELPNAPEEWRDRAISGSAKPRPDHLLPRGRGPVRLPLSKWEDQDESHLTGRELLAENREGEGPRAVQRPQTRHDCRHHHARFDPRRSRSTAGEDPAVDRRLAAEQ